MGALGKFTGLLVLLGAVYVYVKLTKVQPVPTIEETWWGPGKPQKEDTTIVPFKINVSDEAIQDLQDRLKNALPFHPPLEDVNQHYGMNTKLLETIVDYWKTKYNWKKRQAFLNQFPQFKTNIQGLNIHFIHAKPKNVPEGVEVVPLLLLHGWAGSIREYYEIIPILTTPQKGSNFVFEVIVPSLPGFGFSDGAVRPGLAPARMGQLFNKLMNRLKFDRYYIQGGDWGATIVQNMAVLYPDNIVGAHRHFCVFMDYFNPKILIGTIFPSLFFTEKEIEMNYPYSKQFSFLIEEAGYMHIHATKPDTVGVALRDSPVGLAAYILEKFSSWTNTAFKDLPDGGLTKKFTMDQLLDNVMIYWVTNSITSAIRIYSEAYTYEYIQLGVGDIPVKIPTGCNRFEKGNMGYSTETILRERNTNLIHLTDFEDGGHFAALELPEVLAQDIYEFVQKVRDLPKEAKEL